MLTPAAVNMAQRLMGGAAALRPAMTKMMAAIFVAGMSMVPRTVATIPPRMRTVTLPAPVRAPGTSRRTARSPSRSPFRRWNRRRMDRTAKAAPPDSLRRFMNRVAATKMRTMSK
jgi:hypothetical protein